MVMNQAIQVLHAPAGYGKSVLLLDIQRLHLSAFCVDDADQMDPATLSEELQHLPLDRPVVLAARSFPYAALQKVMYQRKIRVWSAEELAFSEAESLKWGTAAGFSSEAVLAAHQKWLGWIFPMQLELQKNAFLMQEFLDQEVLRDLPPLHTLAPFPEITPALAGYLLGAEEAHQVKAFCWQNQRIFRGTQDRWMWFPGLRSHLMQRQAFQQSTPADLPEILKLLLDEKKHTEAIALVKQHFTPEGTLHWLHTHLQDLLLAGLSEKIHEAFHELLGQPVVSGNLESRRILIRSYMAFFGGTPHRASVAELRQAVMQTEDRTLRAEFHALLAWWAPDPEQGSFSRRQALHLPENRHFFRHIAQVSLGREMVWSGDFETAEQFFQDLLEDTLQAGLVCESLLTLLMQAQGQVHHLKLRKAGRTLQRLFELGSQHPERCRPLVAHARALHTQISLLALQADEAVKSAQTCRVWAEKSEHSQLLQQSADGLLLGHHLMQDVLVVLPEVSALARTHLHLLQGNPVKALEVKSEQFMVRVLQVRCRLDLGDHLQAEKLQEQLRPGSLIEEVYLLATRVDVLIRLKKLSEARIAARIFWQKVQFEPIYLPLKGLSEATLLLLMREAHKQGIQPEIPLDALQVAPAPLPDLSDRERTLLQFLSSGQSNQQMAVALSISVNTVKYHLKHLYEKLGVSSREAARDLGQRVILSGW